jgi:autotransporter-associated beta strand protein
MRISHTFVLSFVAAVIVSAGLLSQIALADTFNWGGPYGSVNGQNWLTNVKNQSSDGTCWAFGSVGTMEAKYMLTRNDTSCQPNMSEMQLVWETNPDLGDTGGGWEGDALRYMSTHGVVPESVIPYQLGKDTPNSYPSDPWPLTSVFPSPDSWTNHIYKGVSEQSNIPSSTKDLIKAALKLNGPLTVTCNADWDLYSSLSKLKSSYKGLYDPAHNPDYINHAVVLVGYEDDPSTPTQGYWIIKNSWGTFLEGNAGYFLVPYGILEEKNRTHAETGPVYYTGTFATATWNGGAGTWTNNNSTSWTSGSSAYSWKSEETAATFANTGGSITISGSVSAHGMTVNSTGYIFTGGSLTVTAGGIQANQNVTINSPVTIGAPQTWTTVSGATLNVTGALHTIISDLTVDGGGTTIIRGAIDGGGVINTYGGAAPGNLIKNGGGTLTLTGSSNYSGSITVNAGSLNLAPPGLTTATYNSTISGGGAILKSDAGTAVLGAANTAFSGPITVTQGLLRFTNVQALGNNVATTISGGRVIANVTGTNTISEPFAINNAGILSQLSGTNTFTGAITCTGSAQIWNNGGSMTISSGISGNMAGGTLTFDGGGANLITLTGQLNVSNSTGVAFSNGTIALNAAGNSWAGNATIASGTLRTGRANNLPAATTVALNGGTLDLNGFSQSIAGLTSAVPASDLVTTSSACTLTLAPTADTTYAGRLNGPISLTKNGSAKLILSGANTLDASITTTINAGTLQIGDGGTTGTLPGNVSNNAVLAFARSDNLTFSGNISGTWGSFVKKGTGTLMLNGTNSYGGRTTVAAGTLELALSAQNSIINLGGADIQSGKMVFDYAGGADPIAAIQSLMNDSYHGGLWNIGMFRDSTAAITGLTLGCVDDTASQQVTVMATYAGDFNLDGVVDNLDRSIWFANAFTGSTWQQGDANRDGAVDGLDRDLVFMHVGLPSLALASPAGSFTPVPEPGTLALLAAGLIGALVCGRRKWK